jgi:hypothetical protein
MAILTNPRHERFAQELAKGKSATEAYALAGYAPNDGNCIRLKGNERVIERVAELQQRGAERAVVTVESLIEEAGTIQEAALHDGQYGPAVSALTAKAKLAGHWVERKEDVTVRRHLEQIDADIARLVAAGIQDGTIEVIGGASADGSGDEAIPTVPGHGTA